MITVSAATEFLLRYLVDNVLSSKTGTGEQLSIYPEVMELVSGSKTLQ